MDYDEIGDAAWQWATDKVRAGELPVNKEVMNGYIAAFEAGAAHVNQKLFLDLHDDFIKELAHGWMLETPTHCPCNSRDREEWFLCEHTEPEAAFVAGFKTGVEYANKQAVSPQAAPSESQIAAPLKSAEAAKE